ncbi:unnamed protein product [Gongylonema pulchrum]|uniref:GST C-terminal domain-containing protein n=1 Tax=Gongylonema pulchrum TaxID=637853 RepID=A0A183D832_9BILA|nr:unnamed protein product [Gongylonema pulchrum]
MPYGQLPVLDVNGLLGADEWEAAKIDELIMGLEDLMQKLSPWIHEQNDTKKIEMFKKLMEEEISPFLQRYEKFLANSGTGYFVGNKLSVADLAVFNMLQFFDGKLMPGHLKKYPGLDEFVAKIGQLPKIKAWIQKRPKTNF